MAEIGDWLHCLQSGVPRQRSPDQDSAGSRRRSWPIAGKHRTAPSRRREQLSSVSRQSHRSEVRAITRDFTHEAMAQMIGSSRETVTRLLSDLRRKELIRLKGSRVIIPNRVALQ